MKFSISFFRFLIFFFLLHMQNVNGQSTTNATITIKKTKNFSLNGAGSAKNWSKTAWIGLPQRNGKASSEPLNTKIKILYSETGLYFLFRCEDHVLKATMKSDFMKLWKEDVVEVFLWPDKNIPAYFEYELSPLNYELPILISNIDGDLTRWRPFMYENDRKTRHKTTVQGGEKKSDAPINGWTAEFFIPFKLLRPLKNISPTSGTRWRANFYRVDYDKRQTSFEWQPVKDSFHEIDKFGTLLFK